MAHFVIDQDSPCEKFYKTKEGKIIFVTLPPIGINNSADFKELHERMAEHFYFGDGWPKSEPEGMRDETILLALKSEELQN